MTYYIYSYLLVFIVVIIELLRIRISTNKDDNYVAALVATFIFAPITIWIIVPIVLCEYIYRIFLWIAKIE